MKFSLTNLTASAMSDQNKVSPNNTNTLSCRSPACDENKENNQLGDFRLIQY